MCVCAHTREDTNHQQLTPRVCHLPAGSPRERPGPGPQCPDPSEAESHPPCSATPPRSGLPEWTRTQVGEAAGSMERGLRLVTSDVLTGKHLM